MTPPAPRAGFVTYDIADARLPREESALLLVPGICHTGAHFEMLAEELRTRGISSIRLTFHSAYRNTIGLNDYAAAVAQAIRRCADETGYEVGCVCSHSMGARLTRMAMAEDPALRLPRIELASVPTECVWRPIMRAAMCKPLVFARSLWGFNVRNAMRHPADMRWLFFSEDAPEEMVHTAAAATDHTSFRAYMELLLESEEEESIRAIMKPMLLIRAAEDRLFPEKDLARYIDMLERNESATIGEIDCPHDFFIEQPKHTAEMIVDFCRRHVSGLLRA